MGVRVVPGGRPTKESGEEGKIDGTEEVIEGGDGEEAASGPPAE